MIHEWYGASYELIDKEIGDFLVGCTDEIITPSDGIFYECVFDFRNDDAFPVYFIIRDLKNSESIWKVCTFGTQNKLLLKVFDCTPDWPHGYWYQKPAISEEHSEGFVLGRKFQETLYSCIIVLTLLAIIQTFRVLLNWRKKNNAQE